MRDTGYFTSSNEVHEVVSGEDIGGTKIKQGFVDLTDTPLPGFRVENELNQIDSRVKEGPKATIEQIERTLDRKDINLAAIGLSVAGHASPDGVIVNSANYGPKWDNTPFRAQVEEYFGVPTSFLNDATSAMLSEYRDLVTNRPDLATKTGILFTIGTGLGGGMVLNETVIIGDNGQAAEFGHVPIRLSEVRSSVDVLGERIECGCEGIGCAEQFTNLAFIERELISALKENPSHELNQYDSSTGSKMVLTLAAQGDELSKKIIADQGYNLGKAGLVVKEALDPSWMIIGGGITDTTDQIMEIYRQAVYEGLGEKGSHIEVFYASLGDHAGWRGAATSALNLLEDQKK